MNEKQKRIYQQLKDGFEKIVTTNNLDASAITITGRGLSPEEAIGITKRQDYPILTGEEVMLQAEFDGAGGQAFTDAPATFAGPLNEILAMDIINDPHSRGIYVATMNAVMRKLGLIDHSIHCKNDEPVVCGQEYCTYLQEHYKTAKIAVIGYQPFILEEITKALPKEKFQIKILDLSPKNVGQERFGLTVQHGIDDYDEVVLNWADVILCTGSVFSNATMDRYVDIGKEVIFFGISCAGATQILGLKRLCLQSK